MPDTKKRVVTDRAKFIRSSDVFCLRHGCIHENTCDPFEDSHDLCEPEDHRALYWRSRRGDEV